MVGRYNLRIVSEPVSMYEGHETTIISVYRADLLIVKVRYFYGSGEMELLDGDYEKLSHWSKKQLLNVLTEYGEDLEAGVF